MDNKSRNNSVLTKGQTTQRKTKPLASSSTPTPGQQQTKELRSVSRASNISFERQEPLQSSSKLSSTIVSKRKINNNGRSINATNNTSRKNTLQHSIYNYSRHVKSSSFVTEHIDPSDNLRNGRNSFCKQELLNDHRLNDRNLLKTETKYENGNECTFRTKGKAETDRITVEGHSKRLTGTRATVPNTTTDTIQSTEIKDNINQLRLCREKTAKHNDAQIALEELDIATSEKDFLCQLSDPRLKKSLHNIIKKRRDTVRLSEVVSENSSHPLKNNNIGCENIDRGESICLSASKFSPTKSASGNTDGPLPGRGAKVPIIKQVSSSVVEPLRLSRPTSCYSKHSMLSFQNSLEIRSSTRSERPFSVLSDVSPSSNTLLNRSRVSSPSSRSTSRKENLIETEETRIILPFAAKGYRPCLTRQNARLFTVQSSAPLEKAAIKRRTTMNETEIVREFLIMYARIKSNTQKDGKPFTYEYEEPVQMLSSVPELVVKSAIGQFLTEAFPSKRSIDQILGLQKLSMEEKYEETQRTKLLKIKTCMKHLASMV